MNGTSCERDGSCIRYFIIDVTQCRATIDITPDDCRSAIDNDSHITRGRCSLTITTAVDVSFICICDNTCFCIDRTRSYSATRDIHGNITVVSSVVDSTAHTTTGVTAAIDSITNATFNHVDCSITHAGSITTTE